MLASGAAGGVAGWVVGASEKVRGHTHTKAMGERELPRPPNAQFPFILLQESGTPSCFLDLVVAILP
jgi:hypothetical protein